MGRYYGQWSPPVDQVIHDNYFDGVKGGYFVDCGAAEGALFSCTKFFDETMDWNGICIEPSIAFEQLIVHRPRTINLNVALSDKDGVITFTEVVHNKGPLVGGLPPGGSIHYKDIPKLKGEINQWGYVFTDKEVPTLTFKTLVEQNNVKDVDLLVVDVEGHEMSVINGIIGSSVLPKVICIEYPITGLNKITKALVAMGYRFDFFSFNNAFFSIGFPEKDWFGKTDKWGTCYQDD